jgi:peptidoglycan/LPS O-acetylase OafA/YrhL
VVAIILKLETQERGAAPLWEGLPSVLAVQAWVPDPRIYFGGNGVGWSISCEAFFYLLFPVLILVLPRIEKYRGLVALALVLLSVGPTLVLRPGLGYSLASWACDIFPPARLAEFGLGIVIAAALRAGWRSPIKWPAAVTIACAAYLIGGWTQYSHLVTLVPFALLIAAAAERDLSGRSTSMSRRWPRRLGEWSFAFYLVHALSIRVVRALTTRLGDGLDVSLLGAALSFALALGSAIALYFVVEAPFERRLRKARPRPDMLERPQ